MTDKPQLQSLKDIMGKAIERGSYIIYGVTKSGHFNLRFAKVLDIFMRQKYSWRPERGELLVQGTVDIGSKTPQLTSRTTTITNYDRVVVVPDSVLGDEHLRLLSLVPTTPYGGAQ